MFKKSKKLKGFTLAEMIFAMALLSVIMGLTIPALIMQTNNREYTAGFFTAYSMIKKVTAEIILNNAGTMAASASDSTELRDLYCEGLSCIQTCAAGAGSGVCYSAGYKNLQGTDLGDDWGANYTGAVLNNGMLILFLGDSITSCNDSGGRLANGCGEIVIDVNGLSNPNRVGRDIFYFQIYNHGIIPDGITGTTTVCNTSSVAANNGKGCGGKIIAEGNKMQY